VLPAVWGSDPSLHSRPAFSQSRADRTGVGRWHASGSVSHVYAGVWPSLDQFLQFIDKSLITVPSATGDRVTLLRDDQREARGQGQSVIDLYRKLYKEEFQFVRRHKYRIVDVKAAAPYDAFAACLFGAFPKPQNLKYFASAFKDTFDPKHVTLDPVTLDKLYKSHSTSALRIGHHGLDVDYNDHSDPTLFILDAQAPKDLLDFWNYRATHRSVIAIPVQWLPQLSDSCRKFILRNYRPLPGNPHGVMIQPHCLFSRSIPENEINDLHAKYLMVDKPGANTLQVWYPPICPWVRRYCEGRDLLQIGASTSFAYT
jgi:hypothetical protein